MKKMNVIIDNAVSNAVNASQNQYCVSPTAKFPQLTTNNNQLIVNSIIPVKPSEPIRDNLNPGK